MNTACKQEQYLYYILCCTVLSQHIVLYCKVFVLYIVLYIVLFLFTRSISNANARSVKLYNKLKVCVLNKSIRN